MFSPFGIEILLPVDLNIAFSPEETDNTFLGNSFIKSKELHKLTGLPSIADDSGISVYALQHDPGVFSARYGKPEFSDRDRALYLLENMKGQDDRRAYYTCVLTYVDSTNELSFEGKVFGEISEDYDENNLYGFGYDPIFYYPPFAKRFSEVPEKEKNKVSHRKIALDNFLLWFQSQK